MFAGRSIGLTLRRNNDALIQDALARPHDPIERMDPDFPVMMRCDKCGKHAYGPRRHMSEAIREHQENDCPARHNNRDEPQVMRLLYPRQ